MRRSKTIYKNGNSKSANAEYAEESGRYPLTLAAKKLGVSLQLLKKGIAFCGYRSHEWHHVSKFANKVDYYDTVELLCNYKFIVFMKNNAKNNYLFVQALTELAKERLSERLNSDNRLAVISQPKKFSKDIQARCERFKIPYNVLFNALPRDMSVGSQGKWQSVFCGARLEEEIKVGYSGVYYTGRTSEVANVKYIIPFDLTEKNIRSIIKKAIRPKNNSEYKWILDKHWLLKGIENLKKRQSFLSHNSGVGQTAASFKAKNKIEYKFKVVTCF